MKGIKACANKDINVPGQVSLSAEDVAIFTAFTVADYVEHLKIAS